MDSVVLAVVLIVALLAAFAFLNTILLKVPYRDAIPRERFRWPVWKWYPIVAISLLVVTMLGSIVYNRSRRDRSVIPTTMTIQNQAGREGDATDRVMIAGKEAPKVAVLNTSGSMTTGTSGKATKTKPKPKTH